MNKVRFAVFLLVVTSAFSGAACSDSPASPTSPSSASTSSALTAELAGAWTLTSMQPTGSAVQARPAMASYLATFENGRISARADCNICSGPSTVSAGAVSIGPVLACTRAACATMEFESVYVSLLSGDHAVSTDGRSLTLQSGRGVLRFER